MRAEHQAQLYANKRIHQRFKAATAIRGETMIEAVERLLTDYANSVLNEKYLTPEKKAAIIKKVNAQ